MRVDFKSLSLRNFLSIGDQEEEILFAPGVHLVTGYNFDELRPNGAGKSGVFVDGPIYSMFGLPLRQIRKENLVNKTNEIECETSIDFVTGGKSYQIRRSEAPQSCQIYVDGEPTEKQGMLDTRSEVIKILGAERDVYKSLLVLSASYSTPFFKLPIYEKRLLIEAILGVGIYGKMFLLANNRRLAFGKNIDSLKISRDLLSRHVREMKTSYETLEEQKMKHLKSMVAQLNQIKSALLNLENRNAEIEKQLQDETKLNEQHKEVAGQRESTESLLRKLNSSRDSGIREEKKLLEHLKIILGEKKCPFCGIDLSDAKALEHRQGLENEIAKIRSARDDLDKEINSQSVVLQSLQGQERILRDNINNLEKVKDELKRNKVKISELSRQWTETREKKDTFDGIISAEKLAKSSSELTEKEQTLEKHVQDYSYYQYMIEVLSETGVKAFIIGRILPFLNSKLNFYLEQFGSPFIIRLNNQLEEVIKKKGRDSYQYDSLSGGEKKTADLAMLLTLSDLATVQNSIVTNLLILDEILDSGLDAEGARRLVSQLQIFAQEKEKGVYLISHREELKTLTEFDQVISVDRKDGFSSIRVEKTKG